MSKPDPRFREGATLRAMRLGETLHRELGPVGEKWWLSPSGVAIARSVARRVTADPEVVSGGDGLFANCAQTFRWRNAGGGS